MVSLVDQGKCAVIGEVVNQAVLEASSKGASIRSAEVAIAGLGVLSELGEDGMRYRLRAGTVGFRMSTQTAPWALIYPEMKGRSGESGPVYVWIEEFSQDASGKREQRKIVDFSCRHWDTYRSAAMSVNRLDDVVRPDLEYPHVLWGEADSFSDLCQYSHRKSALKRFQQDFCENQDSFIDLLTVALVLARESSGSTDIYDAKFKFQPDEWFR